MRLTLSVCSLVMRRVVPPLPQKTLIPNPIPKLTQENFMYRVHRNKAFEKKPPLEVIFIKDVPDVAAAGEQIFVPRLKARNVYFPNGEVVYASPFNIQWFDVDRFYKSGIFLSDSGQTSSAISLTSYIKTLTVKVSFVNTTEQKFQLTPDVVSYLLKTYHNVVALAEDIILPEKPISSSGCYTIHINMNDIDNVPFQVLLEEKSEF